MTWLQIVVRKLSIRYHNRTHEDVQVWDMTIEEQWYQDKFLLDWYDETRTIFVIAYKKNYTRSDYYMMMQMVGRMIKNSPHPIVYLNEWDKNVQSPTTSPLFHYRVMNRIFNPQAMIFVIHDESHTNITRVHCNIMGFKENETYWLASTFDEGLQIAQAQAAKLIHHDSDAPT